MTLLEMTVVIIMLLMLIALLFLGAEAWRKGSDRAICLLNIETMQKAVRGFSNAHGYEAGESVDALQGRLIGPDGYFANQPSCHGGGEYEFGGDRIPDFGTLYMSCSLAETNRHEPDDYEGW